MEKTDDKLQKEDGRNIYRSPANNLFDKFVKHKDVTLVYGEPVKHDRKMVLRQEFGQVKCRNYSV